MNQKNVRLGLYAAGFMNIVGVLMFSRGFTNTAINEADPVVMSNFGLLMIAVWGLAYIGAAFIKTDIRWLAAAFAVEKLVYVLAWLKWHAAHKLADLYSQDWLAGLYFSIYGINDLLFMLFFVWIWLAQRPPAS